MEKGERNVSSDPDAGVADGNESSGSSLTLSMTPPLSDTDKAPRKSEGESSISEHLSSVENDRSLPDVEVENFSLNLQSFREEPLLSQEPKPPSINSSFNSNSIISLNGLEKFVESSNQNVKSILEEILNNDQFKSDDESTKGESLDIFANVNLDDAMLNSYNLGKTADFNILNDYDEASKRVQDFEQLLAVKDSTIAALTQELDSFRDMMSNPSSTSLGTSTTEYKQYQEECHNKLIEYHTAIMEKDELIKKLTESLHQSVLNRQELKQQGGHFKNEIAQLQTQLEETSEMLKKQPNPAQHCDIECSHFEGSLNPSQLILFQQIKASFKKEIDDGLLLRIKCELNAKHSKEMEELRTYFEKKCADLEKNYSEEVFSQQSRKMSGSSSSSELELPSDFVFNQPGPGGDTNHKEDFTRKDLEKLHKELVQITSLLESCDFSKLSDEEFTKLKSNMRKLDLKNLIRYDFSEVQNKYHAELEILREDFDNRVDELNIINANKIKCLEKKYLEEIQELEAQIRVFNSQVVPRASVQEVASSGDFEIDEVVQSYERRLQEQVTLAKIDIIGALENQIQKLASSDDLDEDWPEELLVLKSRFSEKYLNEIEVLKNEHELEIAHLKDEHLKILNSALERARRRSLRDADSLSKGELELLKERDSLKKQTSTLRDLIGELLKYFTQCEDELNNTLVEELVRQGFDRSASSIINQDEDFSSPEIATRVHLAPNVDDLLNVIDSSNSNEGDLESLDLRGELGSCLKKLKADANAVLALTNSGVGLKSDRNSLDNKVSSLTRQLINETLVKNSLVEELKDAKNLIGSLESERFGLELQLERILDKQKVVEDDLSKARGKIAELIENGHKEIISEGYGEEGHKGVPGWVEALSSLSELQEKSRAVTERPDKREEILLGLLEEFARVSEKIVEEAKKERDDLRLQIDAADKKYKITCRFLEDQAAEREQERDEAQREIDSLREVVRDRDRDRTSCERFTSEVVEGRLHRNCSHYYHVEQLEQQLADKVKQIEEIEKKYQEIQVERKEAIDKVFVLRDIIRSLEAQVESKTKAEDELRNVVAELEVLIKNQVKSEGGDLTQDSNVSKVEELHRHIGDLEGEVQALRLSAEIAGSEGAITQIRNHLCDFETTLDKRTKELEGFHSTVSTTCSSPSEEMSVRELVNQPPSSIYEECQVPLQQLARLREKLVRHSRAEDGALKRMRDVEMQVDCLKNELEQVAIERDILKKQIGDQLVLISSLQIRLDDQRIRAEHIEKQTNTSLEVRIYDLQTIVNSLEDKIASRDKTVAQLNNVIDETKRRLIDRESELDRVKEDEILAEMQRELEQIRAENEKLKARINNEAQIVPNLVENIISDKNNDIEMLREKLAETERHLEVYNSLSLDKSQLDALNRLRLSGVSFVDLLDDFDGPDPMRRAEIRDESMQKSILPIKSHRKDDTELLSEPEISTIEKIGPSHFFYSLQTPIGKQNSTEKHVRFEDELDFNNLRLELANKNEILLEYESRLKSLDDLEGKVANLQEALEQTEKALEKAQDQFKIELEENEKDFKLQLAAKRLDLDEKDDELKSCSTKIEELTRECNSKDEKILNFKSQLSQRTLSFEKESNDRIAEINNLKSLNLDLSNEVDHLQHLLHEKEKIINQMAEDSKALKVNLETIQAKMKETGNVVDLANRLRDEQKKNWDLLEELHKLKAQALIKFNSTQVLEEIATKELNESLKLDESIEKALKEQDCNSLLKEIERLNRINSDLIESDHENRLKLNQLKQTCDDLKSMINSLRSELEKERFNLDEVRLEDGKLIEQLTLNLNSALNSEAELENVKKRLENELDELKSKLRSNSRSESTEYKDLENLEVKSLKDRNDYLNSELKLLTRAKNEVESNLKYAQDLMDLKNKEISSLQSKIEQVSDKEREFRKNWYELNAKFQKKSLQVENSRALIDEMDQDRRAMKKQMDNLNQRLQDALQYKNGAEDLDQSLVPEKLMAKIRDLNVAVKDNMQMVDLITRLTSEKAILEERIMMLENQNVANFPFDDPTCRANYLFAKYLRSESYRKALIWQKRYLQSLLWTYQTYEFIGNIAKKEPVKSVGRERFRRVGLALVSLIRMKYLVKRWHSGKRIIQQRGITPKISGATHFQVGKPVSSQNFTVPKDDFIPPNSSALAGGGPDLSLPWVGSSPPSKDFRSRPKRSEPLTSPGLLTKYVERFNQIQEKLGMASGPSG